MHSLILETEDDILPQKLCRDTSDRTQHNFCMKLHLIHPQEFSQSPVPNPQPPIPNSQKHNHM
ncbi:hypothetical protein FDUTEX481_00764 [Tolypothrix sp. PCC 7601]|nr:hypothetical protein FDUTEX481_00764 [Tolypothrix sp. PCC 7601]